jgi:hypothetical protein
MQLVLLGWIINFARAEPVMPSTIHVIIRDNGPEVKRMKSTLHGILMSCSRHLCKKNSV